MRSMYNEPMTFEEYQRESKKTATYHERGQDFWYPTLGLAGETGEVVEKIKKLFRDDNGKLTPERKADLEKELGDVLWYLAQIATDAGIQFEDVAKGNIEKLLSRKARGKITGDGDNR